MVKLWYHALHTIKLSQFMCKPRWEVRSTNSILSCCKLVAMLPATRFAVHCTVRVTVELTDRWYHNIIQALSQKKSFEMAWTSPFQDFWAYQKLWRHSYLTYMYLLLGWFASTRHGFSCFLIVWSTLSAFFFYGHESCSQIMYAMCSLNHWMNSTP